MLRGHPNIAHDSDIAGVVAAVRSSLEARQPRIVVLGDVMLDEYLAGDVSRISPEAPIPILVGETHIFRLGGAANVAANLASLGARVDLTGIVGDDEAGRQLAGLLEESAIAGDHLILARERPTTRKLRVVAGSQQIVRIDFEKTGNPGEDVEGEQIRLTRRLIEGADAFIVSDYGKGACSEAIIADLIAFARANGVAVLCDPKGSDYTKYAGSSIITPNRKEAGEACGRQLADNDAVAACAQALRKTLKLDACLVTLGPEGMFLSSEASDTQIPALAQDVADVTGAGDSVIAAIGIGIACGLSFAQSSIFANAVASIAVSKRGSAQVALSEVAAAFADSPPRKEASRLIPREALAEAIRRFRRAGETLVFTNGCFDILHAGHVDNLGRCAQFGTKLIVGLNSDDSVRRLKGPGRPVNCAEDRAAVLLALTSVAAVVIFDEDTPEALIEIIRPDVLAKGEDYAGKSVVGRELVESYGGRVELVAFKQGLSTTGLIGKMREAGN